MTDGTALEKKAEAILVSRNALVHRTRNSAPVFARGRWLSSGNNDVFGCFDLIAIFEAHLTRFVQVTTLTHVAERRNKIDERIPINPNNVFVEVWGWVRKGRKGCFRAWRRVQVGTWTELEPTLQ